MASRSAALSFQNASSTRRGSGDLVLEIQSPSPTVDST